jgi:hypothetical protein
MGDDTPLHLAAAHGNRDIVLMVSVDTESPFLYIFIINRDIVLMVSVKD